MTSFGTLFRQLFLQKSRSAYLIFGIQFLAAFVLTILTLGSAGLNNPKIDQTAINTVAAAFLTFFDAMFFNSSSLFSNDELEK